MSHQKLSAYCMARKLTRKKALSIRQKKFINTGVMLDPVKCSDCTYWHLKRTRNNYVSNLAHTLIKPVSKP